MSSYTADDLFHQDALQDAVLGALRDLVAASAAAGLTLGLAAALGLHQMNRGARFTFTGIAAFTLAGALVTIGMFILGTRSFAGVSDASAATMLLPIIGLFIAGALTGVAMMRSDRANPAQPVASP